MLVVSTELGSGIVGDLSTFHTQESRLNISEEINTHAALWRQVEGDFLSPQHSL